MNTCAECRFWSVYPPTARHPDDVQGACGNDAIKIVSDEAFSTRPDFGCVQFEARDGATIVANRTIYRTEAKGNKLEIAGSIRVDTDFGDKPVYE